MTSKEAFEFIFGQYGINDAGIKIWEAAINWERHEMIDVMKRYKNRNSDSPGKKHAADAVIDVVKRRIKKDKEVANVV